MVKNTVSVKWRAGLHARPATEIVKTANKFNSQITIEKDGLSVDGKSIISMMTLGAAYKCSLNIIIEGSDEKDAMKAIVDVFNK